MRCPTNPHAKRDRPEADDQLAWIHDAQRIELCLALLELGRLGTIEQAAGPIPQSGALCPAAVTGT
jgi:hypothetical protein